MAGGLVDALPQLIDGLDSSDFGRDQTQHGNLAFRHETRRFETTGTLGVVLQQKTLVIQPAEEFFGDGVIVPFPMPHALSVAAADVHPKNDARKASHDLVIGLNRACQISVWLLAPRAHR